MNLDTTILFLFLTAFVERTSSSDRATRSRNPRASIEYRPVLPPTPTFPDLRTSKRRPPYSQDYASHGQRNNPSLSRSVAARRASLLSRVYIVTALAMASSRHLLSVRKSSVAIGAFVSIANSVMV